MPNMRESIFEQSNLTRNQLMLWLAQQVHPEAPHYNMAHTFSIEGSIDPAHFQAAFQALVDRSDAMRTVIDEIDGVPQQRVLEEVDYQVEVVDLSAESDPEVACRWWLTRRMQQPLNLQTCLFDSVLLKLSANQTVWYFNQHHIITDVLSIGLIFQNVSDFYKLALDGRLSDANPLPQFGDYLRHERATRGSAQHEKAVAYWQKKLPQTPEPTDFYGRNIVDAAARAERVTCELGVERSQRLRAIAEEKGVRLLTPNMTYSNIFTALLFAYMHRISGKDELAIGTPFHNRATPAFKQTIGLFINIFPVQVRFSADETFATLLQKCQHESMSALRYAHLPVGDYRQNRAYDVVLNYLTASFGDFAEMPVTFEWLHPGFGDSNHALRLQVQDFEQSGNFVLHFDLNCSVFELDARAWVTKHFLRFVDAFLDDYQQPIGQVSLLDRDEQKRLLHDFNQTTREYPSEQTITQLFCAQVARTPDAIAVQDGARLLTYRELDQRSSQVAHTLQKRAVGPDVLVGLCTERSLETLIGLLGILKAGGAYVPIDATYPQERVALMLDEIDAPVLLTQEHLLARLPASAAEVVCLDRDWPIISNESTDMPVTVVTPDHLAYVIFTSGSTGKPKGVMIRHQGLVNYIWWAKRVYQQDEEGQPTALAFPLFSSLSFDLTVTSIFTPLISGGRIIVYGEEDGANDLAVVRVMQEDAVDIIKLTPAHLTLINEMGLVPKRLRKMIVGGEDFKSRLAHRAHNLFEGRVEIFNEYGPTETVVGCMIHRYDPENDLLASVPIGRPADNAQIYLLDKYDQPVPTGVIGQMVVGGHGVARGYLKRPELTEERFVVIDGLGDSNSNRFYRTGDLARWRRDGQLEFLGRADHQIKLRGHRIELGEIEAVLLGHDKIGDCVVDLLLPSNKTASDGGPFRRDLAALPTREAEEEMVTCVRCGLPSNFPNVSFDDENVCGLCRTYETVSERVQQYFKPREELREIVQQIKANQRGEYDSLVLVSGGKDSTYMLYQLVALGLRPLIFTLDNGYISEGAKSNIRRVAADLLLDVVFAKTPHMNAIFADSLKRYCNVCNGCFKTIYTLSTNLAKEKGIGTIFTGLARGQLFETRLAPEVFQSKKFDVARIDDDVLDARKIYHRQDDLIARTLDVEIFQDDAIFEEVQFVDFYRYWDVSLEVVLHYLETHAPWIRPSDTGRSTNCLINDVGIYIHKKKQGYHNYALPYSWDVRLGHKERAAALDELDDDIDVENVEQILREIGYEDETGAANGEQNLVAYYVAEEEIPTSELREYLAQTLPVYMIPTQFVQLEQLPLTANGKVDRSALADLGRNKMEGAALAGAAYVAPEGPLESRLADLWAEVLNLPRVGVDDDFFALGGTSLPAIQIVARTNQEFDVDLSLRDFFEAPTVAQLSTLIEEILIAEIEGLSEDEAEMLAAEMG